MGFVSGLLDRAILVGGVLAGGTIPSFIAQYRQRVGGHLDQVLKDLKPFQDIAKQFHNGNLEALIRHHQASSDPSFRKEGEAIAAMQQSALTLSEAIKALQGNAIQQLEHLVQRADPAILKATWAAFQPGFSFTGEGLAFAGAFGLSVWLLFMALSALVGKLFGRRAPRTSSRPVLRKVK